MLDYRPAGTKKLGQFSDFTGGLTSGFAQQVVEASEPVVRKIIKDERNKFAEALIGGIPWAVISAAAYVGTRQLVPEKATNAKAVGYGAAALSAAIGAWWTLSRLTEEPEISVTPEGGVPGYLDPVVEKAANSFVAAAEPKVRAIVDEERARIAAAGQIGIPFWIASAALFLSTLFIVPESNKVYKAVGYSATALLMGVGAWMALEREREN